MEFRLLRTRAEHQPVGEHMQLVHDGSYRLPEFQRTFVWDDDRVLALWDSLHHGFPVGQVMLWQPRDVDFPMRSLGRKQLEVDPRSEVVAVIDGQQRLTALYVVLIGDVQLRFDLEREEFTYDERESCLRLDILADGTTYEQASARQLFFTHATVAQRERFAAQIARLNTLLSQRQLPAQTILGSDYATVVGVFRRLNQQGEPLNQAQLTMAAISTTWPGVFRRTYDLIKRLNLEMGFAEADDPSFVFRIWAATHTGQHLVKHLAPDEPRRSRYGHLVDRTRYEASWARTERGLTELISMMRNELDLVNFRFIKGDYPLAVAAHFFATHPDASEKDRESLRRWIVLSIVSGRYHEKVSSRFGADVKATTAGTDLRALFHHRHALDPFAAEAMHLTSERVLGATFPRSPYVTLLYLVARRLRASDWMQHDVRVGDVLADGPWHFHHIFPDETFYGERGAARDELEQAQIEGDDAKVTKAEGKAADLEQRIRSVGNLAFLIPRTNSSISNRSPTDYLREIAATEQGRRALEAQCIPLEAELWVHSAFDEFCTRRCELIVAAAKRLFFADAEEKLVWAYPGTAPAPSTRFWQEADS